MCILEKLQIVLAIPIGRNCYYLGEELLHQCSFKKKQMDIRPFPVVQTCSLFLSSTPTGTAYRRAAGKGESIPVLDNGAEHGRAGLELRDST